MLWALAAIAVVCLIMAAVTGGYRARAPRRRGRSRGIDQDSVAPSTRFETGDAWMLGLPATTRSDESGGGESIGSSADGNFDGGGGDFGGGGASGDWGGTSDSGGSEGGGGGGD